MTKQEVLLAVKTLRNKIYNEADTSATAEGWEYDVIEALEQTIDLFDFRFKNSEEFVS